MSKAKGAVKGTPVVVENPEGAKFATVKVGTSDNTVSMLINLNCPVDIILDNVKRHTLKKLDAIILDVSNASLPVAPSRSMDEGEEAPPPQKNKELTSLQQIKNVMTNPEYSFDLCDSTGVSANCKQNLKKLGCDAGVLAHKAIYNVVCIATDGSTMPCFIDNAPVEEPVGKTAAKKK